MVLIRLLHAAHLPTPGDVVRKLEAGAYDGLPALGDGGSGGGGVALGRRRPGRGTPRASAGGAGGGFGGGTRAVAGGYAPPPPARTAMAGGSAPVARFPSSPAAPVPEAAPPAAEPVDPSPASLPAAAEAAAAIEPPADFPPGWCGCSRTRGRADLSDGLYTYAHLVRYDPAAGRLEFRPGSFAPKSLSQEVGRLLLEWTGRRWMVSLSDEPGERTLAQQDAETKRGEMDRVRDHPVVAAVLSRFPGARLVDIHAPRGRADAGAAACRRGGGRRYGRHPRRIPTAAAARRRRRIDPVPISPATGLTQRQL